MLMLLRYLKTGALAGMLAAVALVLTHCGGADNGTAPSTEAHTASLAAGANPDIAAIDADDVDADEDIAPKAKLATVISWDSTGALRYSVGGNVSTAFVTQLTAVRLGQIQKFSPPDPILPLVQDWNAAIAAGAKVFGPLTPGGVDVANNSDRLSSFVALSAHFRIKLNANNTVKALRPVP